MAALTPTDIANMALGLITEAPIDTLEEDSRAARMLNLHYETTREAELRKSPWVFAIQTATIEPVQTNDPAWRYSYELPADALRALPVMDGSMEAHWRQQAQSVQTCFGGSRSIRYIANLVDPNDWPSTFTDVLAAALAVKVAHAITGKTSFVQIAQDAYRNALATARVLNAVERGGRRCSPSWETERAGHGSGSMYSARARHGGGW